MIEEVGTGAGLRPAFEPEFPVEPVPLVEPEPLVEPLPAEEPTLPLDVEFLLAVPELAGEPDILEPEP